MKKYLIIASLCMFGSSAMASMYLYQPIGSSIVLGGYGNRHALSTAAGNPASTYLMANLQGFRVGFLGPLGIAVEGGGVNGINDKIDDLTDIFDDDFTDNIDISTLESDTQAVYNAEYASNGNDAALAETVASNYAIGEINTLLDDVDQALADADVIIDDISETVYAKFSTTLQAPFAPIIYKTRRRSVFSLDASASIVGRASLLSDNLTLTGLDDLENLSDWNDLATADISNTELQTNTASYIKRASDYRFSLGYSEMLSRTPTEAILIGARVNFHKLALGQKLTVLEGGSDPSVSYGDFFISRDRTDHNFSVDLGAMLVTENLQLGITVANVNQPTFSYEKIGNCSGLTADDLVNCNAAISFANDGDISLDEKYKMRAQTTIDGAIKSKDQNFSLGGSYDLNAIEDPLGDEYQWSVISLSMFSDYILIPGIRVGLRKNLVGSKLEYYTAGATIYRRLEVDAAYAPENDDGNAGLFVSVGYSFVF